MAKKKTDYTQQCWSCGGPLVFPEQTWYKCKSCGATYNIPISLGPACMVYSDKENDREAAYHQVAIRDGRGTWPKNKEDIG